MGCCSRYTFGIIIGSINLVASAFIFIAQCIYFEEFAAEGKEPKNDAIKALIISAITALISVIFIFAIIKRKYKLILAWLILCVSGMIASIKLIIDATKDNVVSVVEMVVGVLTLVIEIAVFWFSLYLYKKMRSETVRKPGSAAVGY